MTSRKLTEVATLVPFAWVLAGSMTGCSGSGGRSGSPTDRAALASALHPMVATERAFAAQYAAIADGVRLVLRSDTASSCS